LKGETYKRNTKSSYYKHITCIFRKPTVRITFLAEFQNITEFLTVALIKYF